MYWSVVALVFSILLDLFNLRGVSNHEKDLEILILQYQLDILGLKQPHLIRTSRAEELTLADPAVHALVSNGRRSKQRILYWPRGAPSPLKSIILFLRIEENSYVLSPEVCANEIKHPHRSIKIDHLCSE